MLDFHGTSAANADLPIMCPMYGCDSKLSVDLVPDEENRGCQLLSSAKIHPVQAIAECEL